MDRTIASIRLQNQKLSETDFRNPEEVISWFGAMQAQDYAAAKWAVALRSRHLTDDDIERAFNEGRILRTHIMRPTWHFVTPADIRWLLALTSANVQRFNGSYFRKSGYDRRIFAQTNGIIADYLDREKQLTRNRIADILKEHGVPVDRLGLSFVLMQAETDGVIVSGPRVGKQFTYMLLNDRAPKSKYPQLTHDEALSELTVRYFQSHGPAQVRDFSWWSGLKMTDIRNGIRLAGNRLRKLIFNGKEYWMTAPRTNAVDIKPAYLIPAFDEYFIAYRDRSDILDPRQAKHLNLGGGMINGAVVVGGRMVGGWKRTVKRKGVTAEIRLFEKLPQSVKGLLHRQLDSYGKFLGRRIISVGIRKIA